MSSDKKTELESSYLSKDLDKPEQMFYVCSRINHPCEGFLYRPIHLNKSLLYIDFITKYLTVARIMEAAPFPQKKVFCTQLCSIEEGGVLFLIVCSFVPRFKPPPKKLAES